MGVSYVWTSSTWLMLLACALFIVAKATEDPQGVSKRHLRWQDQTIKPDTSSLRDIQVQYFIPHPNSARAVDTAAFTGFTIYERNGMLNVPPNAGIFAFVSTANAIAGIQQGGCVSTMHAGAYYYIYKKCPEDETMIVASGHCRVDGELRFNSGTFNEYVAEPEDDPRDVENLSERHLRWQGQIIKPDRSSLPDIPINYFIPHPNSARAVETASFTGFTVYQRNGNPNVPPDAGYFAFVSTADAQRGVAQGNCIPTMHAGAYYHIFKRCPEDENRIVASGHCRVNGELRFNSGTFNQPVGRDYLYEEYYLKQRPTYESY